MYENELIHYGVKGMKWGVRRAERRDTIQKYKKEYNDMTKNDSRLTKTMNKLAGSDKVYAVSKYAANKQIKTYGPGSLRAVSNKAAAAGRVAGIESKVANRNNNSKKTGFQRDVDALKANVGARMNVVREAKAANKARKQKINDAYSEVKKNYSSFGEKLLYNNATRKAAAKYMVDNNMSMSDAKKRANKTAIRNTTVLLAAYGAYTVANLKLNNAI